jgi:hypothetical protein
MEDDIFMHLPMVTVRIAKQERRAHMVAHIMITIACAFINIACIY